MTKRHEGGDVPRKKDDEIGDESGAGRMDMGRRSKGARNLYKWEHHTCSGAVPSQGFELIIAFGVKLNI